MMSNEEIEELLQRFLDGRATPEETEFLQCWFDAQSEKGAWDWRDGQHRHQIGARIKQQLVLRQEVGGEPKRIYTWRWAAAAAVLAMLGVFAWIQLHQSADATKAIHEQFADESVPVGSEAAILVLTDGTRVPLDNRREELFADGQTRIAYLDNGEIAYDIGDGGSSRPASTETNTLHVPKGGSYRLRLPDGSIVALNSGSSITFPLDFGTKERRVKLIGEAIFTVHRQESRPFYVEADDLVVRVLGTSFNVRVFPQDSDLAVTLVSGRVEVEREQHKQQLTPGEQAFALRSASGLQKRAVNLDDELAWQVGYFSFENQSIGPIMQNIARWYDIEIEFESGLSARKYSGRIARSRSLEDVLISLETLGDVKFHKAGRRVTVMR